MSQTPELFRPIPTPLLKLRRGVRSLRLVRARLLCPGEFVVSPDLALGGGARILSPEFFRMGNLSAIAANFHAETNVSAGDDIVISSQVAFVGNDHDFSETRSRFLSPRAQSSTTVLEGRNFIGFGCILVGNVTIGEGAIVGAGSIVTRDLPRDSLCVGSPARPIRDL